MFNNQLFEKHLGVSTAHRFALFEVPLNQLQRRCGAPHVIIGVSDVSGAALTRQTRASREVASAKLC